MTKLCIECIHFLPHKASDGTPYISEFSESIHKCAPCWAISPVDGKSMHQVDPTVASYCRNKRTSLSDPCGPAGALWEPSNAQH